MPQEENSLPIQVTDLHKSFGRQTVLDGVELQVRQAETVAVMGRSGTGKSVLLKLLIGLQRADSDPSALEEEKSETCRCAN